jgi:hypothetical protein
MQHRYNSNELIKLLQTNPQFANLLEQVPARHPAQLYEAFCYVFYCDIGWAGRTNRDFISVRKEVRVGFESSLRITFYRSMAKYPIYSYHYIFLFFTARKNQWDIRLVNLKHGESFSCGGSICSCEE